MTSPNFNIILALIGGILLAIMIKLNSALALSVSPVYASWLAHGIGTVVALLLIVIVARLMLNTPTNISAICMASPPIWSYFGGIPGALVIIFAAMTVNSSVGLLGTLVLGLLGQIIFGLVVDSLGLFGLPKKVINRYQSLPILMIVSGSYLIILSGPGL